MRGRHPFPAHQGPRDQMYAFGPWRPGFGGPFGPPGHGDREHRRRGGRGRRANVREAILALLAERPMHGYEMIQEIEQRSRGGWRPSPGSVYPTLQLLEDEGLILAEAVEGGRKQFTLTDAGRTAAQAGGEAGDAPWQRFSEEFGDSVLDSRHAIHGIMQAMGEVIRVGTADQRREAQEVLDQARRKLYQILAGGE